MLFVGIFIIIVGCVFVSLGAATVIANIITSLRPPDTVPTRHFAGEAINAVTELINALGKLPPFALMVFLGVFLLAIGQRLLAGLQIFSY